jgi:hypothetical protein
MPEVSSLLREQNLEKAVLLSYIQSFLFLPVRKELVIKAEVV